jgi:hypothetical protein
MSLPAPVKWIVLAIAVGFVFLFLLPLPVHGLFQPGPSAFSL